MTRKDVTFVTLLGPQPALSEQELRDQGQELINTYLAAYVGRGAEREWDGMLRLAVVCCVMRSRVAAHVLLRMSKWCVDDESEALFLREMGDAVTKIIDAEQVREAGFSQAVRASTENQPGTVVRETTFIRDPQGIVTGKREVEKLRQ